MSINSQSLLVVSLALVAAAHEQCSSCSGAADKYNYASVFAEQRDGSIQFAGAGQSTCHVPQPCAPDRRMGHLTDLPGFTRSVYTRDHALITPESRVFAGQPNW